MSPLRSIPNVRRMRGEYDRQRRAWLYRLHWRVGKRTFNRVQWLADDAAALDYIRRVSGQMDGPGAGWQELVDRWKGAHGSLTDGQVIRTERSARLLQEFTGAAGLEGVTAERLSAFLSRQTPGAAARHRQRLLALARWGRRNGLLAAIPFEHVGAPKYRPAKRRPVAPAELPGLLAALPADILPIVLWIALTGCRQGYACAMRMRHVTAHAVIPDDAGKHRRAYQLDADLRRVLELAAEHKRAIGSTSDAVFVGARGQEWTETQLCHRISEVWPSGTTLHCLRHMWGTELGRTQQAYVVQAALGHRSVQSAIPYVHLAEDAVAQAQGSRAVRGTLVAQIRTDGRLAGVLQRQAASARHDDLVICPHCGNQLTQRTLRQITKARKSIRRRPGRVT